MSSGGYSFADAAAKILGDTGKPLHANDITRLALEQSLISTEGKTPTATMQAILAVAIKKRGAASRFVRVRPGTYGLSEWAADVLQVEARLE